MKGINFSFSMLEVSQLLLVRRRLNDIVSGDRLSTPDEIRFISDLLESVVDNDLECAHQSLGVM